MFDKTSRAQPQTKGDITDVAEIYKDKVRPAKQIIRGLWSDVFNKLHLPNQREEEVERIMNIRLKRETIAEDTMAENKLRLKRTAKGNE